MSEEELENGQPPEPRNTTQENALAESQSPNGEWQMPEPVYRQTSGYLPQGFEKQFPQSAAPTAVAEPASSPEPSAAPHAEPVEEQPDIIEVLASEPVPPPIVVPAGRSAIGVVLIILGLLAMVTVVVCFAIAVYFLFFAAPAETSF